MNLRIACVAALVCAPVAVSAQIWPPLINPCATGPTTINAVLVVPNPLVTAWQLCQSADLVAKTGTACAEISRKYAETGIAAREQAEREKAANDYAACALNYIRNVAAPE